MENEKTSPLPNGITGASDRDEKGRFLPGNSGGPGNPNAAAVNAWRAALVEAITPEDFTAVVQKLTTAAKAGKSWAIREFLDRTLGRPAQAIEIDGRVESNPTLPACFPALLDLVAEQLEGKAK